jgi:hypothetical protein
MSSKKAKRVFEINGTRWGVEASAPGASNAMILFRHPDGRHSGLDRYNWFLWNGPEARSVTARLDPKDVLDHVNDAQLERLFRRSMAVSTVNPPPDVLPRDQ